MKYIKEYKEFESDQKICDRCGKHSKVFSKSMYNNQLICLDCKKLENEGKVTGDDFRSLEDEAITSEMPIFPAAPMSQMIYNL